MANGIISGDILVKDNIIEAVGTVSGQSESVINAKGNIILPGFINTHCHAAMYFMKSSGKGLPVKEWLSKEILPIESKMTPHEMYLGTKRSCLDMIKSGITCFSDMFYEVPHIIKAVEEVGIRCCPSWCLIGPMKNGYNTIEKVKNFLPTVKRSELIRPIISCHAPFTCSTETLKLGTKLAENFPRLDIHVSENQQEVKDILEREGARPVEYLESIGFLSNKVIFDHAVHLDDNEIQIIKKHNIKISHCPASNQWLNSGTIRLRELLDAEIIVSLGTDGPASNDYLSIQHEMKKARELQDWEIPAETLVKMATINGAITLGLEKELGSIEIGKKADLIILDSSGDWEDILTADINTVICNGKVLLENKKLKIPEKEIIEQFEKAQKELMERV